jgi:hypothetical protein
MRWILAPAVVILASQAFVSAAPPPGPDQKKSRFGFPRFLVPDKAKATIVLPDAERILRQDGVRERRKEEKYWQEIRVKDEARIRDRNRIETELALARATARAAASRPVVRATSSTMSPEPPGRDQVESGRGPVLPFAQTGPSEATPSTKDEEKTAFVSARDQAQQAVRAIDAAVDKLVEAAPAFAPGRNSSGFVFFLLLIAVFLVPAVAISLVLLAIVHLRNGHRLQSAVFGLVGCALLLLVAAAGHKVRGEDPGKRSADAARLRAACEASAVDLRGFVNEVTPFGVVVSGAAGAPADEHGWVLVVTDRETRSGNKLQVKAYPVGPRMAENAIGQIGNIPAYADSLEAAISMRAEAEHQASLWWWQRMLQTIRKA